MADESQGQAGELTNVEITPQMIEAGVKVLRESGMLEYERLIDATLVREVLRAALAAR